MKILLSGYAGAMGQRVIECAAKAIACGVSRNEHDGYPFPTYTRVADVKESVDVILDFSHADALKPLLDYAVAQRIPIVVASTGLSEKHHAMLDDASRIIPVLQSGNFSIGIHVLQQLAHLAARALPGFDIEIIEKHHNQKRDAPSGTAEMLKDEIIASLDTEMEIVYDRHDKDVRRQQNEIGIHTVRGGTLVGEHMILFAGTDEVIEISHTAQSKMIFAQGSLVAARFLIKQEAGRYNFTEAIRADF